MNAGKDRGIKRKSGSTGEEDAEGETTDSYINGSSRRKMGKNEP